MLYGGCVHGAVVIVDIVMDVVVDIVVLILLLIVVGIVVGIVAVAYADVGFARVEVVTAEVPLRRITLSSWCSQGGYGFCCSSLLVSASSICCVVVVGPSVSFC